MYRTPFVLHQGLQRHEIPVVYVLINTSMGWRGYATKEINAGYSEDSPHIADGSVTADGGHTAGSASYGLLDLQGRIVNISSLSRILSPVNSDILGAYTKHQLQHISITLADSDDYFGKLLAKEPMIGKEIRIYVGFDSDAHTDHLRIFNGKIASTTIVQTGLQIEAEERLTLNDMFYLSRAGRYTNPLNTNDRLPIVYGDLTDGADGNWILPCIDTVNYVYCFAAHEVLSVANGNSINIYKDGVLVNPANYTFDETDDYESAGAIAKITFSADQGNAVISARGKGKPTTSGGATLMNNIVDIIYDFLTVHNSLTSSDFESTKKAKASASFVGASYSAAGVIHQDINYWDLLQQMIGSFFGSVYLDANNKLCIDIDTGTIDQHDKASIFRKSDIVLDNAYQALENLINQCPASYCYNYVLDNEFNKHDDGTTTLDAASQTTYGAQKSTQPYQFYWCRNLTTVQAIQAIIVAKLKNPLWLVTFTDLTLKNIHVDVGDLIVATIEKLYDKNGDQYLNHLWKVTGVEPELQRKAIRYYVEDTGKYLYAMTYLADGTYKADGSIHAGSDRDMTEY